MIFLLSTLLVLLCSHSVVMAQENGALVGVDVHRFRFSREFIADDMFAGDRCVLTGEPMREYDETNPGQLFQSCWAGVISASVRATGAFEFDFDGISSAAVVALGNDSALQTRYNMSDVTQFTPFASIRMDPATEMDLQIAAGNVNNKVQFQSMQDAQLQPLLNVTRGLRLNATALASLSVFDGPNYFLVRFAQSPSTAPNLNLTGAALRKEILGNSMALIKLYIVISPRASPIMHWEVLGATSNAIQNTENAQNRHGGHFGGILQTDTAVAEAGVAIAVIALILSLFLCVAVWRMRHTAGGSYTSVK